MTNRVEEINLCIGGPLDGQRMQVSSQDGFVVPILEDPSWPDTRAENYMPNKRPPVQDVRYVREMFCTTECDFAIWRPADQSLADTMQILLDCYERNTKAEVNHDTTIERQGAA